MSQKVTFPEDFWWGAAMSGPQMEGTFEKPHENVMDYWYKTSKEEFFNGVGPTVAKFIIRSVTALISTIIIKKISK